MASKSVTLAWTGEGERFEGGKPGGVAVTIDGDGVAGPSPMDALLLSLAGCMGIDVLMILEKSRVPIEALEVSVEGDRRDEPPRRYTALRLEYRVRGPREQDQAKLDRAVALSKDKYCSVLHTLRPDVDLDITIRHV